MPGRRENNSSVSQSESKGKRKGQSRFLNAFSIAEQEASSRIQVRKNRLGEIEDGGSKRRREAIDTSLKLYEGNPDTKRLKRGDKDMFGNEIEGGSDSEGNEWVTGHVHDDDDSSLDSDEAFGSDDGGLERFALQGSSHTKPPNIQERSIQPRLSVNNNEHDIDLEENKHPKNKYGLDSENESEGFAADAVDLATVLDQRNSDSENELDISGKSMLPKEHKATETESEIEYGPSDLSQSEPEDEGIGRSKLKSLENFVSSLDPDKKSLAILGNVQDAQEVASPSDYGVNPTQKLTIADLLHTVTDSRLRKSLRSIAKDKIKSRPGNGVPQRLNVPLAKRQQDRIDRSIAFEKSKETLDRWIDTVQHNRRVQHLHFPLPNPDAASAKNIKKLQPVTHSEPLNDLEATIRHILVESDMAVETGKSGEEQILEYEELATNKLPIEEVKRRRAELRKARDLLFRQEIKAKRIKKIKSKSYRKVHRKEKERNMLSQRENLLTSGYEPSEDEREQMHRQRAEERMGARHRESKWVKATKQTGRATWDEDARAGVVEMAKRQEELKRRIQGEEIGRSKLLESDTESNAEGSSSDEDGDFIARTGANLQSMKRDKPVTTGLSSLGFMKKAEAALKARNDNDIERLQIEVDGAEPPSEDGGSEVEGPGRRSYGPVDVGTETASKNKHMRTPSERGLGTGSQSRSGDEIKDESSRVESTAEVRPPGLSKEKDEKNPLQQFTRTRLTEDHSSSSEVPWIETIPKSSKGNLQSVKVTAPDSSLSKNMSPSSPSGRSYQDKAAKKAFSNARSLDYTDSEQYNDEFEEGGNSLLNRQDTFLSQAFETDDAATTSFAHEKAALVDEEAPREELPTVLPGWGSWTGHGLSKREKKYGRQAAQRTQKYLRAAGQNRMTEGVESGQRKDKKLAKVIISEKRVPKNARYLAGQLPHTFETKSQYERSLRMPVGPEWSTKEVYQQQTKPRVLVKGGIITAMSKPMHA